MAFRPTRRFVSTAPPMASYQVVGLYFHHIYSEKKMKRLQELATNNAIRGLLLTGR
jgi:hypothetical protein